MFFRHGDKETLRACVKAIILCCAESQADLRDFANKLLKELESELTAKLKTAIKEVQVCKSLWTPLPFLFIFICRKTLLMSSF